MDQWKEIFPKFSFTFRLIDLFSDEKNKENKIIIKETKLIRKEDAKKNTSIPKRLFYDNRNLIVLDLSDKKIKVIPPGFFNKYTAFKKIFLRNNKLSEIPVGL